MTGMPDPCQIVRETHGEHRVLRRQPIGSQQSVAAGQGVNRPDRLTFPSWARSANSPGSSSRAGRRG